MIQKQILKDTVFRGRDREEPWRELNNIVQENLNKSCCDTHEYVVLFDNITDCNKIPNPFKFVVFDWVQLKVLVYREPELKIYTFDDYNTCLEMIKRSEPILLKEGLTIHKEEEYKRVFFV